MGHYDSCYEADDRRKDHQEKEEPNYLLTIAALKKENAELQAKLDKAKWQPIETAPKGK